MAKEIDSKNDCNERRNDEKRQFDSLKNVTGCCVKYWNTDYIYYVDGILFGYSRRKKR